MVRDAPRRTQGMVRYRAHRLDLVLMAHQAIIPTGLPTLCKSSETNSSSFEPEVNDGVVGKTNLRLESTSDTGTPIVLDELR
ncbi:hypothetical protein KIN20_026255 [Parelaphostrongylus tenuis]|uniref:Uncharacterized protein n=1 Tax=Parelaphostrongylus tenuis TaxID=148309 RepID=A0AAD5QX25_PARTN|nr:hypothetical protein KIN20_026255 [Parelaphostrongylus tenuis]